MGGVQLRYEIASSSFNKRFFFPFAISKNPLILDIESMKLMKISDELIILIWKFTKLSFITIDYNKMKIGDQLILNFHSKSTSTIICFQNYNLILIPLVYANTSFKFRIES